MSAGDNKVKKAGRVEYIEPNSIFVHSDGDAVQNGIPQPYEDYSLSVHLRVIVGNRYDCGLPADGNDITNTALDFSSENGTISFMDGTSVNGEQGYLTTNFTDINMNDPSTNTKECIGIESISIRYNSWYAPTVDIKFIDVRGASLMQPAEYEYYNNGNPRKGEEHRQSNSNFFKAFFSFPYPLFKLSVKGFYGKEVTYDLSVVKCNVEFNSSTGNFEVAANFIGYMYGMYADLPFPFVYIAPYIDLYGKNTWEEKKSTGDFCYLTSDKENPRGEEMYTYPELRSAVQNASKEAKKIIDDSDSGQTRLELTNLSRQLTEEVILNYPMTSRNYHWWTWSKVPLTEEVRPGYYFLISEETAKENRKIFEDFITFTSALTTYNQMVAKNHFAKGYGIPAKQIFTDLEKTASDILLNKKAETTATASTVSAKYSDDDIKGTLENYIANLAFHADTENKDNPQLIFDEDKSTFASDSRSTYDELIVELKRRFEKEEANSPMLPKQSKKKWVIRAIYSNNINYRNGLSTTLTNVNKALDEVITATDKERTIKIREGVKFDPTMRNMYNMLFAHIDTFMSVFYNTLDRIRSKIQSSDDMTRKADNFIGENISCDVNPNTLKSTASNGGKLPPFTMFYSEETEKDSKNKRIKTLWPGSLPGGDELDEVKLVEAIINATSLDKRGFEPVTPKDNVNVREGDLVPINYYDLIRKSGNPYLDVLKNDKSLNEQSTINEVVKVFMLRCYYTLLSGSYLAPEDGNGNDGLSTDTANFTKKAKLIAELEAGNVERAFKLLKIQTPPDDFRKWLMNFSIDGSKFVSEHLKGDNAIFSTNGADGNLYYKWISKSLTSGEELYTLLPVGVFEKDTLANYINGANLLKNANKFLKISKNGTNTNNLYSCYLYKGGKYIQNALTRNTSGDFKSATRLFKNGNGVPNTISKLKFSSDTFLGDSNVTLSSLHSKIGNEGTFNSSLSLPSYRKTSAGITNIFMDPFYYAQVDKNTEYGESSAIEARAYLFLMGVPFGENSDFFLPERAENGDYPTLMLLREGAVYWRSDFIRTESTDDSPTVVIGDPITYTYTVNGSDKNVIDIRKEIEENDPRFGRTLVREHFKNPPMYVTEARKQILIDYFKKWATGLEPGVRPGAVTAETQMDKTELAKVPTPSIDFPTIERNLCLMYTNGNLRTPLSPSNCYSAVTVEVVDGFSNASQLVSMYNVGTDRKLGKIQKIRKDVLLRSAKEKEAESFKGFLTDFTRFYIGFDSIIDFACPDSPNKTYTVPRNAMNDAVSSFVETLKKTYNVSVGQIKDATGTDSSGLPEDARKKNEQYRDEDLKLACYLSLKSLYDRWLCSRRRESWFFSCMPERMFNNGVTSDFTRFFYMDEFYHEIGMRVRPNLTNISEYYPKIGAFTEKTDEANLASASIMKVLSTTAEEGACSLLTLPTMLGLARSRTYVNKDNSLEDVFKAFPYNEAVRTNEIETSFITLYSDRKSSTLNVTDDTGNMAYCDDGFDLANTWGEIVPQPMFSDDDEDSFVVPCFGVTFAKQNQSYFKDVKLSMEDHQLTEYAIKNTLMISYMNNRGPRETSIMGQDLYSVFANYSYTCSVTMMGDTQITPLMYFQLNNIPMWKGAYLITAVQHTISSRGMETVFTGTRQSRYSMPFKGDDIVAKADSAAKQTPQSQEDTKVPPKQPNNVSTDISKRPLDLINVENVNSIIFRLTRTSLRESSKWINGILTAYVYYKDGTQETYNVALTLEINNGIGKRIENFKPEEATAYFTLPCGRYPQMTLENSPKDEEYRDPNESFYTFTEGKHIMIVDSRLAGSSAKKDTQNGGINTKFELVGSTSQKKCEIITGVSSFDVFEEGGVGDICIGAAGPIMLYPNEDAVITNTEKDAEEIRAIYREIFDLVKRMHGSGNHKISLFIVEADDIEKKTTK